MRPQKILVTGASGFLGCRLVERLVLGEKVPVRAMAHRPGKTSRLARLPAEIAWADITDSGSVERAVEGCDVIVHCAYGTGGDRKTNHRVTVEGTRLLAKTALAHGVRRFVHISTIAVYSYSPPERVDEQTPFVRSGDPYCDDKIEAEEVVWRLIRRRSLPAVVLRMGNIYGPFSAAWTVRPLNHIHNGYIALVDEGNHASNAVFVDNVVEAILRAIREDAAVGEAFFVTDDEISWRTWYGHYAAWLEGAPLISVDSEELGVLLHPPLRQRLRLLQQDLHTIRFNVVFPALRQLGKSRSLGSVVSAIWQRIPGKMRTRIKEEPSAQDSRTLPPSGLLQRYASQTKFSNEKAKRQLGFGPLVTFEEAARITERWARWARLI
jgi:nucleoside-diphosphate-sugar epimerase